MSEPKLISPMLDGFVMGEPISDHHGVRCCPAMIKDTDKKYIVKIISIPASQVQLEALLLTGAYTSKESALAYFKELSLNVENEVEILRKLSNLEGFLPYENCQVVPMENEVGYDVYLLSPYRRSLERFLRKNTMTHLGAVNLGLDLCAALAICRQAGYLYVDLKPGNVYITGDKEYRIGDLGFTELSSLAYASLPDRYRSAYTPPEIADAFASLNSTMDVYAAGLILYQVFNGGTLPFDAQAPGEELPSPLYADYEMAEIIQKACAPDPKDRWQTPIEMGHALVSYMQRNEVNDVPIVPPAVHLEETSNELALDNGEQTSAETADDSVLAEASREEDPASLAFMDELEADDTTPDESLADRISYDELSVDTSDILSQVDELLTHKTPDGVIQPAPIDVPVPPPIVPEPKEQIEDIIGQTVEQIQSPPKQDPEPIRGAIALDEEEEDEDYYEDDASYYNTPRSKKGLIAAIIAFVLLAALAFGGYVYYTDYYLQTISDLQITGSEDAMNVSIVSEIDDSLLTVVFVDPYGNKRTAPVSGGKAAIDGLNPNTLYTVRVEIAGFHKLTGTTSKSYNTPAQTNIITFSAIAGSEDGSVILNFTVDGQDADKWLIRYKAEGEEEKTTSFTGHMVIISGLSIGKEYTFRIDSENEMYIVGNTELTYSASSLIFAENLEITACANGSLTAVWQTPAMANVKSWSVRCYNSDGYDQTISTDGNSAVFTDLDTTKAYTVEVVAQGMTAGARCYVSANSVTIGESRAKVLSGTEIEVTWEYTGPAPTGNWMLMYTIDGSDRQEVVRTDKTTATISPIVPGTEYTFTILLEDGSTVFGESFTVTVPKAEEFSGYTVKASDMTMIMVKSADIEEMTVANWQKLNQCPFAATTFAVGESVSIPVRLDKTYGISDDTITALFVIRDENGKLISSEYNERSWTAMWRKFNCTLELPSIPEVPGKYTVEIYFNGYSVNTLAFEVIPAQ